MARTAVRPAVSEGVVVTKAALRAAALLGISNKALARIVGVSEATVSRMGSGTYTLRPDEKPFELAVLFIRFYRALDAIVHGDDQVARAWLIHDNAALGDAPLTMIQSLPGLVHAVAYLDARRALV
jgi:antitoxin Xre/MbcA/ParS-like protein